MPPAAPSTSGSPSAPRSWCPTLGVGPDRAEAWFSRRWTIWLPVLDMVALGIYRISADTSLGVAVVFPAIWLGLQFGRRGVVVTTVTMLVAFVVPTLSGSG